MTARLVAVRVLTRVVRDGQSFSRASGLIKQGLASAGERAFAQEICYGVLRWFHRLDAIAGTLLNKPFKEQDSDVYCAILSGLYQMLYMRTAPHAAVSESVQVAAELGKPWARGVVNAVLRRFQRERTGLVATIDRDFEVANAHPHWLCDRLQADWPQSWREIVAANNQRPPFTLRVNRRRIRRDDYLQMLAEQGIVAVPCRFSPVGLILDSGRDVGDLPGFDRGLVSVQDEAAQLAAELMGALPGERILDACAAPGGKTAHILELQPDLEELVAVDHDSVRMDRVAENLQRLDLQASLRVAEAQRPEMWWDGRPFDRILLDAPCSATGVIRRNPDIKLLRRAEDIGPLAKRQGELLSTLWPLLKPGGMLLYVTCSVLAEENSGQGRAFLAAHSDCSERPIDQPFGSATDPGRQILPGGDADMDGFYYLCLVKGR